MKTLQRRSTKQTGQPGVAQVRALAGNRRRTPGGLEVWMETRSCCAVVIVL